MQRTDRPGEADEPETSARPSSRAQAEKQGPGRQGRPERAPGQDRPSGPERAGKPAEPSRVGNGSGQASGPVGNGRQALGEAHSAFTPPPGIPAPSAEPEDEHPTSGFAVPQGVEHTPPSEPHSAFTFTPAHGIPVLGRLASSRAPWQDRMRTMVRLPVAERPAPHRTMPRDEGTDRQVPRVLDLTLRIGELLLAGGEGAEDVEAAMFAVAHAYGLDRCEPTVTFTLLSIAYQPSLVDDPVTISRTVRRRAVDYTRLAAVFRLVADISQDDGITLEEAYRRLAEIRRNRHPYPSWVLTAAGGTLAGAASTLVVGWDWWVFLLAAAGAMLGDRLAWLCSGRGLPEFYQFVAAALAPAAVGLIVGLAEESTGAGRASAVVTGGLFALIPGRALVAGVQDGLTGYYITASARLLEVGYLVVGIVCGVLLMLYLGVQLGVSFNPEALPRADSEGLSRAEGPLIQLGAAMLLSLTFCVLLQQERRTVLFATLNGGVAWLIYGAMHDTGGIAPVAATLVAAGLVGLFGQLQARYRHTSSLIYITASIGPLLPGNATYFGLLGVAQGHMNAGIENLSTAAALALAIAIGVNLGGELARLFIRLPGVETPLPLPLPGRRAAKRTRGF